MGAFNTCCGKIFYEEQVYFFSRAHWIELRLQRTKVTNTLRLESMIKPFNAMLKPSVYAPLRRMLIFLLSIRTELQHMNNWYGS